jgi:ElaB/YqjD/DUF883 family membrane-anchored ribosome-binding protein
MSDTNENGSPEATAADEASATPAKSPRKSAPRPKPPVEATEGTESGGESQNSQPEGEDSSDESSRVRAALQAIEERAQELRRWGMAGQERAREAVEEHPLTIVGAAFGVGLLIGLLTSRI